MVEEFAACVAAWMPRSHEHLLHSPEWVRLTANVLMRRRFAGPIKCIGYSTGPDGAVTELQAEFDADYQGKKPPKVRLIEGSRQVLRCLLGTTGRTHAELADYMQTTRARKPPKVQYNQRLVTQQGA